MAEATLEEMAQALARGREQLAEAEARVEELKAPYHAAVADAAGLRKAVELIEQGMETAKRAHLTLRAIEEASLSYEGPLAVNVQTYGGLNPFVLVAVGPEGTGLYLHTPKRSHRYQGKEHAIPVERLPEGEEPRGSMLVREAGLAPWEERGRGQWGAGSGPIKPKAPPEGGRWRWLKVREQELLAPTTEEGDDG